MDPTSRPWSPASAPTWAGVAKRAPPRDPAFVPPAPAALVHTRSGVPKTSFRRWKWESASLAPSDSSSASESSLHSLVRIPEPPPPPAAPAVPAVPAASDRDMEAALLAAMPRAAEARPAAVAAAAAFRAVAPYLSRDDCSALHRVFATSPPLDCLAVVVRMAQKASAPVPTSEMRRSYFAPPAARGESVWGLKFSSGAWGALRDPVASEAEESSQERHAGAVGAPFVSFGSSTLGSRARAVWAGDSEATNGSGTSPAEGVTWDSLYSARPPVVKPVSALGEASVSTLSASPEKDVVSFPTGAAARLDPDAAPFTMRSFRAPF